MSLISIPTSSREYLYVPLTAPTGVDLGDQVVELAITRLGTEVEDSDWTAAAWAPDETDAVRLLVGPDTTFGELAPGFYQVRVRIVSEPERPVRLAGTLMVLDTS